MAHAVLVRVRVGERIARTALWLAGLVLQRRGLFRTASGGEGSWQATEEIRPIPKELLAITDKALALDPNLAEAHSARGEALANSGRRPEAGAAFDAAFPHRARMVRRSRPSTWRARSRWSASSRLTRSCLRHHC